MKMKHPKFELRNWWRIPRLIWWLIRRPQDINCYIKSNILSKKTPLDIGKPWWSFGAVKELGSILRPNMSVFEYGSGGSSIFIALQVMNVTCVEDKKDWADLVEAEATKREITNIKVLYRDFDFFDSKNFEESDYLNALNGAQYDIIVVDGTEESRSIRQICFWHAERQIKPGGVIIVDDSWRYPEIKKSNKAHNVKEFKGTGYCRNGVTSTCFFYY